MQLPLEVFIKVPDRQGSRQSDTSCAPGKMVSLSPGQGIHSGLIFVEEFWYLFRGHHSHIPYFISSRLPFIHLLSHVFLRGVAGDVPFFCVHDRAPFTAVLPEGHF